MKIAYLLFGLSSVFLYVSCNPDAQWAELDLLPYGISLKINAPEDAEVKVSDMVIMKDVTIKSPEGYDVQIFVSDASTLDVSKIKEELKNAVESAPFFSRIIQEDDHGFIYEKKIDENTVNYDFRYVVIRGDKKYVFQRGLTGIYTLDQVKKMYQAIQQ